MSIILFIQGSDLHQALINMGLHNFDSVPKVKTDISLETEFSAITVRLNFIYNLNSKTYYYG